MADNNKERVSKRYIDMHRSPVLEPDRVAIMQGNQTFNDVVFGNSEIIPNMRGATISPNVFHHGSDGEYFINLQPYYNNDRCIKMNADGTGTYIIMDSEDISHSKEYKLGPRGLRNVNAFLKQQGYYKQGGTLSEEGQFFSQFAGVTDNELEQFKCGGKPKVKKASCGKKVRKGAEGLKPKNCKTIR